MTKKLKFTLAIALNEILEIFIRREESEVISKLNFSIENFEITLNTIITLLSLFLTKIL